MKKTWVLLPIVTLSLMVLVHAALAPQEGQNRTKKGQITQDISTQVSRLIYCESGGKNQAELDSNGKYSYGILQFQLETWNEWSKESGIGGEPMNKTDAVKMAKWAIQQGYIKHWTEWEYAMGLQNKCKWQR